MIKYYTQNINFQLIISLGNQLNLIRRGNLPNWIPDLKFKSYMDTLAQQYESCPHVPLFLWLMSKFKYSEKATKFCEILTLVLFYAVPVKSKVKISQNFVASSEYVNFTIKTGNNLLKMGYWLSKQFSLGLQIFALNWIFYLLAVT